MATSDNYRRISFLGERIKNKTATQAEKDEYIGLLYNDGLITQEQYNNYQKDKNTEDILKASLLIGAIALVAYLLGSTK